MGFCHQTSCPCCTCNTLHPVWTDGWQQFWFLEILFTIELPLAFGNDEWRHANPEFGGRIDHLLIVGKLLAISNAGWMLKEYNPWFLNIKSLSGLSSETKLSSFTASWTIDRIRGNKLSLSRNTFRFAVIDLVVHDVEGIGEVWLFMQPSVKALYVFSKFPSGLKISTSMPRPSESFKALKCLPWFQIY